MKLLLVTLATYLVLHSTYSQAGPVSYGAINGGEDCPKERGFCVLPNGDDQNSGVIKLDSVDGNTIDQQAKCLSRCQAYAGATGCEVIWNQRNRGCYVHTHQVARGNNVDRHSCWIFSKCKGMSLEDLQHSLEITTNLTRVQRAEIQVLQGQQQHYMELNKEKNDQLTAKDAIIDLHVSENAKLSTILKETQAFCNLQSMSLELETEQNEVSNQETGFSATAVDLGEIEVRNGHAIVSVENFQRPLTVEAEMESDGGSECISMTLFAPSSKKNDGISLEIGGWVNKWRFFPGDNQGQMGRVEDWRKVKLEVNQFDNVKFYVDDDLKYETTSSMTDGKLRFIAGCVSMKVRNIIIERAETEFSATAVDFREIEVGNGHAIVSVGNRRAFVGVDNIIKGHAETEFSATAVDLGEIEVGNGHAIVSVENFQRPLTVEAEMKSDGGSECISMTLFAPSSKKNDGISLEIGGWINKWRFFPGDNQGKMGRVEDWRKVKLEVNQFDNVKFYVDDDLKYETTSSMTDGKLRFIAGCVSMKVRNIRIERAETELSATAVDLGEIEVGNENAIVGVENIIKGCDVGAMYLGNCYLLVSTPATWLNAQLDCTSRNGSLAEIHNAGTNHFIGNLSGGSRTWIGATDAETEGEWKWTDGNIPTFFNWGRGEPNNWGGNQNCLKINFRETDKWDDDMCDNLYPYVCQGQKLIGI